MMTRGELEKSLADPMGSWAGRTKEEVRALLGEDAARMVGFDQRNPHHCYDLWLHVLHTVEALPQGPDFALLRTAALFHDIAKPAYAREKDGRLVFYGHAEGSAQAARPLLEKLGYSRRERELICFWIGHHDDFTGFVLPGDGRIGRNPYITEISEEKVRAWVEACARREEREILGTPMLWHNLCLLCRADASAQADTVSLDGRTVMDTKKDKVGRIGRIARCLPADC